MNSITFFVAIALFAVAAATPATYDKSGKSFQVNRKPLGAIRNKLAENAPRSRSTLEIDWGKLSNAFEDAYFGSLEALKDVALPKILAVMVNYREASSQIRNVYDDAGNAVVVSYYDFYFKSKLGLINEDEKVKLLENAVFEFLNIATTAVSQSDQIVKDTNVELVDSVKEIERQLYNEIDFYVQVVLKIIRDGSK